MLKRPLIRSSRAAGAKPVGRISGSGEDPIARLFDHATNPAEIDADELTLPFRHLACDEHIIDVAGIHAYGTLKSVCPLCRSPETATFVIRDREFESTSLQQRVRLSPDFASVPGKTRVFRHFGGRAGRQRRQRRAKPGNPRRGGVVSLSGDIRVPQCCRTRFARLAARAANEVGVAISVGLGVRIRLKQSRAGSR